VHSVDKSVILLHSVMVCGVVKKDLTSRRRTKNLSPRTPQCQGQQRWWSMYCMLLHQVIKTWNYLICYSTIGQFGANGLQECDVSKMAEVDRTIAHTIDCV